MEVPVNYLAVVLSAIAMVVLGALWYGPLFGKKWRAYMGFTEESMKNMSMTPLMAMSIMALAALVMSFVLSHVLVFASTYMKVSGASAGLSSAFWMWLGFIVPVTLGVVLWEGKSWGLWVLNAGYYLVSLVIAGALLGSMM